MVLVHGIVEIEADGMVVATKTLGGHVCAMTLTVAAKFILMVNTCVPRSAPGIFGERGFLVSGSRSAPSCRQQC